jgi:CRISPR-associated protein Cas1
MSGAALPGLPPPRPIPLKDRYSMIFIEKGNVDVLDGDFVIVDIAGAYPAASTAVSTRP